MLSNHEKRGDPFRIQAIARVSECYQVNIFFKSQFEGSI